ncbi:uncharacterized protein G6M90_00g113650 [Metarhizium brunneum]|uniref:Uncharacterized protein n=1 Tax=Metarhizium brunneum TaxID=500148 RepID=A0A7D5V429_9HYPO|nr:hypothetical protein G6M90_00g113650 [Metarhizium brunneum]
MPPRLALQFTSLRTLSLRGSRDFQIRRTFHDAKADFIAFDLRGSLTTQKLDIFIGEPHEAYIIFNKDIGLAMKSGISNQTGICLASDSEKIALTFSHDTLHFTHGTSPGFAPT